MPPKRHLSDRPADDTYEGGQEFKKRKTHRHRGQIKGVMEDFTELLNPATSESLAKFNRREEEEHRWGVVGLDAMVLGRRLKKLMVAMDTETLDAKLNEMDKYLATKQGVFRDYIKNAREQGDDVVRHVAGILDDLLERIEEAREQLPGMPSYWMNCHGKANC